MKNTLSLIVIIICATFFSCEMENKSPNHDESLNNDDFFFNSTEGGLIDEVIHPLFDLERIHIFPKLKFHQEINTGWKFKLGNPQNGLKVSFNQKPDLDSLVTLPHRINFPNWPFWYEQKLKLDREMYLFINADDGAQCFVDGILQEPQFGNYFFLPKKNNETLVTIRVLNNALKGGLRQTALIEVADFSDYMEKRELAKLNQQLLFLATREKSNTKSESVQEIKASILGGNAKNIQSLIDGFAPLYSPKIASTAHVENNEEPFSFTAWGDSQGGWNTFAKLVEHMAAGEDHFSIGLGDLVSNGVDKNQWASFTQSLQPLLEKQPVFPIVGNHDYDGYYNDLIPLCYKETVLGDQNLKTYFSWTYQGVYYLALDPNETFPLGIQNQQRQWMLEKINSEEWKNANWRFILIHQPPYSQGWPEYHGDEFIRELVDSLAEKNKIDFVLSGHSHDYERLSRKYGDHSTHFFILGGAGGGLEPPESSDFPAMDTIIKKHHYARFHIDNKKVRVTIHDANNEILDEWSDSK